MDAQAQEVAREIEEQTVTNPPVLDTWTLQGVLAFWYPEVPRVMDLAAHSLESGSPRCVVILRGVPGSGKTMFAEQLKMLAAARGYRAAIYGHGTGFSVARYYADVASRAVQILIIDNVHARVADFAVYLNTARADGETFRGGRVIIVSFWCNTEQTAQELARRSPQSHQLTPQSVSNIFSDWQPAHGFYEMFIHPGMNGGSKYAPLQR
jgi:hypothetical protein